MSGNAGGICGARAAGGRLSAPAASAMEVTAAARTLAPRPGIVRTTLAKAWLTPARAVAFGGPSGTP